MEHVDRSRWVVFSLMMAGTLAGCSGRLTAGSCDDAWTKAAAACPSASGNSQQHQEFLQQCNNPESVTGCQSQASALAACVKQAASFVCASTGQPEAVGCDAQGSALGVCLLGSVSMDAGSVNLDGGLPSADTGSGDLDGSSVRADAGVTAFDAAPPSACDGSCLISFASGPDWSSFAGTLMPDDGSSRASYAEGASLGPARIVCQNASTPSNCPASAVVYGWAGQGWRAGDAIPQASWIWRADVTPTAAADLQIAVFEKTFELGTNPTGLIQVAADDFAQVFVNDLAVGSIGSITDITAAGQAQNTVTTFDLTPALKTGSNKITVVGQNGPTSFSGACGATACTYAQNPAGVDFAGTLTSR